MLSKQCFNMAKALLKYGGYDGKEVSWDEHCRFYRQSLTISFSSCSSDLPFVSGMRKRKKTRPAAQMAV